ncbi:hypothetical protein IE53DRAFT_30564 [Violaceomyces palustris]|uniref:Uncharacterized protein n=1 Tax=Violaceomyces palustris TaxID=1673888 RepID=A0ACD0P1D6_9BASI|nr:hypothetical protein IE53DRAFT_30564 [Violaceomyces palustris]
MKYAQTIPAWGYKSEGVSPLAIWQFEQTQQNDKTTIMSRSSSLPESKVSGKPKIFRYEMGGMQGTMTWSNEWERMMNLVSLATLQVKSISFPCLMLLHLSDIIFRKMLGVRAWTVLRCQPCHLRIRHGSLGAWAQRQLSVVALRARMAEVGVGVEVQ